MTAYDKRAGYPGGTRMWAMEVKADDPNYVVFASDKTFYRTIDGGTSWAAGVIMGTGIRDIRALPDDPNVLLMSVLNGKMYEVRRSTDFGATWTSITDGYPASIDGYTGQLALIAVTPAAPKSVWVHLICKETATGVSKTYDVYKSENSGVTFKRLNVTTDLSNNYWQSTWNEAFAISDTDSMLMASGAYGVSTSRNGGASWTASTSTNGRFLVHSAIHSIVIKGQTIWAAGDGGIQKSIDYGVTYNPNVDDGIQSQCIWGFDQAWKSDIMSIGMYHGPTTIRDDSLYNGWFPMKGADAYDNFINTSDDRYIYAHPWDYNRFKRSTSRNTSPQNTPITTIMTGKNSMNDPDYYEKVYGAQGSNLVVSGDNAATFTSGYVFNLGISDYVVALSNNKIAYARTGNTIMRTEDGGVFWTDVSPTVAVTGGQLLSQMVIDGSNPSIIWVSIAGKQTTNKVAKSTDGGTTWVNYTGIGLPSYVVNCIIGQMGTNGDVYIGTDAGVYYRNNSMNGWIPYNANLPLATHVNWIKLNYSKAKLRIAGKTGIWESDLNSTSLPFAHPSTPSFETQIGKPVQFVDMSVCLANAAYEWTFPGGNPSSSTLEKPIVTFTAGGDKNITLKVTDTNGTNSKTYANFLRVRGVTAVPKAGWIVTYYDSQNNTTTSAGNNIIDGNNATLWLSRGTSPNTYPHDIHVDMGASISTESFEYTPRQDGSTLGGVMGYEWYVSNDGVNWGTAVATGNYANSAAIKVTTLASPVNARYFRFRPLSSVDGSGFASAAELAVNGSTGIIAAFAAANTFVKPGSIVQFTDNSAGNPTTWAWSFPGGIPSMSNEQNPVVTYPSVGTFPVTLVASNATGSDIQQKNSYMTISKYLPQTGWRVIYVDSEETLKEKTPATNLFDGNSSSFWGTNWSTTNPACPHEVQIDMGGTYAVTGCTYLPRQNSANGRIANYEFYVSTDAINWNLVNSGTFLNTTAEQSITFPKQNIRYFRMRALSEVNGSNWTAIAEIKIPYALSDVAAVNNPLNNNIAIYSYQNEIKVSIKDQTRAKMQVFDITGCEIMTTDIYQGVNSVDIGHPGVYIVKVLLNNGIVSRKVIVE